MKNLLFTLLFFAGIITAGYANPTENPYGENISNSVPMIIIDMGHGTVRAGLFTNNAPTVTFQADAKWYNLEHSEANFKAILTKVFNQLNVTPSGYNIIITKPLGSSEYVRHQLTNVLMRDFNVAGMYLMNALQGALYSVDKKLTGAVAFSENNQTIINTYYQGIGSPVTVQTLNTSAKDLGHNLTHRIQNSIMSAEYSDREDLFKNICLVGSQMGETEKALVHDGMYQAIPSQYSYTGYNVYMQANKDIAVWIGIKGLFSDYDLSASWFTQGDYKGGVHEICKKQPG